MIKFKGQQALLTLIVVGIALAAFGIFWYESHIPTAAPATTTGINPDAGNYAYTNASGDTVLVDTPIAGAAVGRQFSLSGKARGAWYFEGSFPYQILNKDGALLTQGAVQAQGDWMSTDFVPFSADVTIPGAYTGAATVLLHNDNPSGDSANAASVSYPITIH